MHITTSIGAFCPCCGQQFRAKAERLREGESLCCPHCGTCLALSENSGQSEVLRLLSMARQVRQEKRYRRWAMQHGYFA